MVLPSNTPPRTDGIGKMWFAGVDITQAPYYAGLTTATQYWLLDGYTSTQFTTGPDSLGISRAYPKDWVIHVVINSIAPDRSRQTLMRSIIALNELFDPTQGPQQLVLAEFPGSYWVAQNQGSKLDNEAVSPQMFEADIDFACTGPAYSVVESNALQGATTTITKFTITSDGDKKASPLWRVYVGGPDTEGAYPQQTTFSIANTTTGEVVSWAGTTNFGDVIEFIMDAEYGTPYTVFHNSNLDEECWSGPAWPHLAPGTNEILFTQGGNIDSIIECTWRDRFNGGQVVVPQIIPTQSVKLPTGVTLDGADNTGYTSGANGSYIFSGSLQDIYLNPMPAAPVSLYSSTDGIGWNFLQTVTTNASGKFTFAATTPTSSTTVVGYESRYSGDATHYSSVSIWQGTLPPSARTASELMLYPDTSNLPMVAFDGTLALPLNFPAAPLTGQSLYMQILVPNGSWMPVGGLGPQYTDGSGNYDFAYHVGIIGTSPVYFRSVYPGTLYFAGALSNTYTINNQTTPLPAQSPGPITYGVGLAPEAVDAGLLNYFAACGFTEVILVAESGAPGAGNTYATELATIKSFGMTPVLDIEGAKVGGIPWSSVSNDTQCYAFNTWFAAVAAAGWQTVSSEHGNTGYPYYPNNAGAYFSGYINYNIPYSGVNSGLSVSANAGQKNVVLTSSAGFVAGMSVILTDATLGYTELATIQSINGNTLTMVANLEYPYNIYNSVWVTAYCYWDTNAHTTQNLFEFYYNSDIDYVESGTNWANQIGVPSGILAYPVPLSVGIPIWNNSINGGGPTYQNVIDWSYTNGVGMNNFTVWMDPNFDTIELTGSDPIYFLLYYLNMQGDSLVRSLQQTYPPAGTETIKNITMLPTDVTLGVTASGSTYIFLGTLTELFSGNILTGATVTLQVSTDGGYTWANESGCGTNPTTTDDVGAFSWSKPLTSGTYRYRVAYGGSATYLKTFAPYSHFGMQVVVP